MANNAISNTVTRSPLIVEEIRISDFQKEGTATAVIRQTVVTKSTYPTKSVSNEKQDNIFSMQDFGFEEQEFTSTRDNVSFMDVPEGSTVESVQAQLNKFPDACNYRILSNEPILTSNQQYSIDAKLKTLDDYANSQAVRFPTKDGVKGKLILDPNGKVQYRAVFFSATHKEDIDERTSDNAMYLSKALEIEFNENVLVNII